MTVICYLIRSKNIKMVTMEVKTMDNFSNRLLAPAEMVRVSRTLNLTFSEFNDIFFNSELQFCNF